MSVAPNLLAIRGGEALASPAVMDLLDQCWDVRELDGGLVEATVPVHLIKHDDVPVDQPHVVELAASIEAEAAQRGSDGQLSRTSLAQVDGYDQLFITDGFHRDGSVRLLGRDSERSTIRLGTSMEEVTDLRILAATGHNEVMFARVVQWVNESWGRTPWAHRLTAEQAFSLFSPNKTGERLGISPEEAREIRDWALQKGEQWHLAPATVHEHLSTAEKVDPVLAKAVRQQLGTPSSMSVTQGHLSAIGNAFPMDYGRQHLAVSVITGHRMSVARTKVALELMGRARSFDDMVTLVNRTHWSSIKAPTPKRARSGDTKGSSGSDERDRLPSAMKPDDTQTVPPPRASEDTVPAWPADAVQPTQEPVNAANETVRRLTRENVLGGLQLARYALDRLVLSGSYVAPVLCGSDIRALKVTYGDDPEVAVLARPVDIHALTERFDDISRKATPNALAMLEHQHKITGAEAGNIIKAVRGRVLADMNQGDLRFLGAYNPATFQQLLFAGINEELQRRRAQVEDHPPVPQVIHTVSVTIGQVVDAMPRLNPAEKKAVLMYGVIGLSAVTTARLIGGDVRPTRVPQITQFAGQMIKSSDR